MPMACGGRGLDWGALMFRMRWTIVPRSLGSTTSVQWTFTVRFTLKYPHYVLKTKGSLAATTQATVNIISTDKFTSCTLIRQGLLPCSPFSPTVALSIRVLELYRVNHLRCPHLAIQPWVKSLCDMHGVSAR